MANRLSDEKRQLILRMLCEGNSIRGISRITGCHKTTIGNLILGFGNCCRTFLDETLRDLTLGHVEIDEMWTYVAKKQARLTLEERQTRHDIGDIYLWTAIDQDSKLIASHVVGKRSADNARRLMTDLASRINFPAPGSADDRDFTKRRYEPVIQISTDGFAAYPEAVDLAFGPFAAFGQIIKEYRNSRLQYEPSEIVGTIRRAIRGLLPGEERSICTSHIERHNLTVRTFTKRFARLSLGFSKSLPHLEAAVGMFLAYYNFVWRTRNTDRSETPGKLRPTAAMMAGVTDRLWKFGDLYAEAINYG